MNGTTTRWGRAARPFVGGGLLLAALLPAGLAAQIPGGPSTDFDLERATFRAAVLDQVRPVMASWEGAWRGDVGPTIESFYTPDALVAVGDTVMGGNRTLADFARATRRDVAALVPSMLDFDASESLAYVYGSWTAKASAGGLGGTGRLVTILRKSGKDWMIRSQLFAGDSVGEGLLNVVEQEEPLPSVERRVAVGSKAMVPVGKKDHERPDARSARRISAYRDLIALMSSMRAAWGADDAGGLEALMRDDAWVQLPGIGDWAGRAGSAGLDKVLPDYGSLYTTEEDFDYGGTLAYLSGRYYAERTDGESRVGGYMAVFQNLGSGWQFRSLAFF